MADLSYDKLHLGCGSKYIPGYVHVDANDHPHVDVRGPVDRLDFIPDNSSELIYACHLLEHFGRHEIDAVLAEWLRVLKPGGVLRVAVPDFDACSRMYQQGNLPNGVNDILGLIMGGQRDQYDFHKMIFDEASLGDRLKRIGFSSVARYDWRTTDHAGMDDYSQSYIPHMDKDDGVLMSLNLEATK